MDLLFCFFFKWSASQCSLPNVNFWVEKRKELKNQSGGKPGGTGGVA